jgi:hypothetical protein
MPASQGATSARCARLAEKTLRAAAASEHAAVSSACASACKFHSRAAAGGALDAALALAQALVLMCLRAPAAGLGYWGRPAAGLGCWVISLRAGSQGSWAVG